MACEPQVLVVSTHPNHCKPLIVALDRLDLKTALAFSAGEAIETLTRADIPIVCTCTDLVDGPYNILLNAIRSNGLRTLLVVITPKSDCHEYLDAMDHGVFDFLPVPSPQGEIERIVGNALRAYQSGVTESAVAATA